MIYYFRDEIVPDIHIVGGKGKSLIETTMQGLPVPNGFVLSVEFFDPWIRIIKESVQWKKVISETTQETCDELSKLIDDINITQDQIDLLENAMKCLKGNLFAVRSSSPEEDLEEASFAGQYDTLLGVDRKDVLLICKKVFKSCFDYRVLEYKNHHNIDLSNSRIAVVVQEQISSDISGVGFSINPINNAFDEILINASYGLGEMIVSGLVTPDTYIIDVIKKEILSKEIGEKKVKLEISTEGKLVERELTKMKEQALTDVQILDVSTLVKKCEQVYSKPIDIEWAYQNDKLYLLQVRPITTYVPIFDELITKPGDEKLLYIDILTITQGFSDSLSVLGTDIWREIVVESGGHVLTCNGDGTAPVIHGRQYFNIFYLYKALGKTIGNGYMFGHDASAKKMMDNIDLTQYKLSRTPRTAKGAKFNMLKMGLKFSSPAIHAMFMDHEQQIVKYLEIYDAAYEHTNNYDENENFNLTVERALQDIGTVVSSSGLLMAGLSASNSLKKMFKNTNVQEELAALSMDLKGNPTSEMGYVLFNIANSEEFINTKTPSEFELKIIKNEYPKEFMTLVQYFINKHGSRTFKEIDIASSRAGENLQDLFKRIKDINVHDNQINKVKEKKEKAYKKLLEIAQKNGFEKRFKKKVEIFQSTFGYREYIKYSTVNFIAQLRRIALLIGERFVERGQIDEINQIFDLHVSDIVEGQKNSKVDLRERIQSNLIPYKKMKNVKEWPIMFDSRGKIYRPVLEVRDGDYLGMSISPGKYIGRAKVLASPYEKSLESGEILVTRSTEPSWTPIFINASAVVMEVGGPLQHGGIIAREYGIPCVSGLVGITEIIEDGDLIEVDGSTGLVRIVEKLGDEIK